MCHYPLCLQVRRSEDNSFKGNPPTSSVTGTTRVDRNYQFLGSREFPLISDSSTEDESVFQVGNSSSQVMNGKYMIENKSPAPPPDVLVNTVQIENQENRTENQTKEISEERSSIRDVALLGKTAAKSARNTSTSLVTSVSQTGKCNGQRHTEDQRHRFHLR